MNGVFYVRVYVMNESVLWEIENVIEKYNFPFL